METVCLISPSDGELMVALDGRSSPIPERYGADVLAPTAYGLFGVQRKEFHDLLASVADGRLAEEIGLLKTLPYASLMVEGRGEYTSDGVLIDRASGKPRGWTRQAVRNILRSCWYVHGIRVEQTDDVGDTARAIEETIVFLNKKTHRSLLVRPKGRQMRDDWKRATRRAWSMYLWQSFPGVGPDRAEVLLDAVGVPLAWQVSEEELRQVDGIGPIVAKRLLASLPVVKGGVS